MSGFSQILRRDVLLSAGRGTDALTGAFFFALVAALFALSMGGMPDQLLSAAPGVLWVAMLLAALLAQEMIWHRDFEDGTFDHLLLAGVSPFEMVCAKMAAHWIISGLVLTVIAVPVSQILLLPAFSLLTLVPSLLVGSLYLSIFGGLGACLTLGARRPGVLMALIVLPLYVPMLLLGILALSACLSGQDALPSLLGQMALLLVALPPCLLAGSTLLKQHVRS